MMIWIHLQSYLHFVELFVFLCLYAVYDPPYTEISRDLFFKIQFCLMFILEGGVGVEFVQ